MADEFGRPADVLSSAAAHLLEHGALVVTLDEGGVVTAVSPSVGPMLGWDPDAITGRDSIDLIHPADRGAVFAARQTLTVAGRATATVRVRRLAAGWRVLALTAVALPQHRTSAPGVVIQGFDVTAYWRREKTLAHAATHDPLTQLPNRGLLMDRLREARARQHRHGGAFAVCYLDVDGLKQVNDTYGHGAGDLLLQETATALRAAVRGQDFVARLGGDEYVVVFEDLTEETAEHVTREVLARVRDRLAEISPAPGVTGVRASAGLAYATASDTRDGGELLAAADTAMYGEKRGRRRAAVPGGKPLGREAPA